ncbi:DUF1934 domain-containing protein [Paenibacillus senegalensis]|uniref:DUF1934 domain-containing protein n=1 Tax=Paenibacillus senegalensis TaxID=1465766 RepID=UPI0002895592|nr:DUF1934 domain-containing protein [Paenibacillus senegalensis]
MASISSPAEVEVSIVSYVESEKTHQQVKADLYVKGEHIYLRYPEKDLGQTNTTVKIHKHQLKIIRHGEVASEQLFIPGKTTSGFYETPQGRLLLEMSTKDLQVDLNDGIGQVAWSYDLFFAGEHAGAYRLSFQINRKQQGGAM